MEARIQSGCRESSKLALKLAAMFEYGIFNKPQPDLKLPVIRFDLSALGKVPGLSAIATEAIIKQLMDSHRIAGEIEDTFAKAGYHVISNSSNHRMDPTVPLLIPEVNGDHLKLILNQRFKEGSIVTNPNCSVVGITMALKPLIDLWGIEALNVVTLQAVSGAGYPGIATLDILDNVIPFIHGEEEKIENEPLKILGIYHENGIIPYPMQLSAQCTRVCVADGHLACVSVKLKQKANEKDIIRAWKSFQGAPQELQLPSAPKHPIIYLEDERHPQPKYHRSLENGMAISIGRLRKCPLLDWKFILLSHNTVRGAAGCAILNAEFMAKEGYFGSDPIKTACQ
jgi:aspartate-semialdehyde dehydrogenase